MALFVTMSMSAKIFPVILAQVNTVKDPSVYCGHWSAPIHIRSKIALLWDVEWTQ
jgi:hypothetical protein